MNPPFHLLPSLLPFPDLLDTVSKDPSLCDLLPFLLSTRDVETLCEALRAINAILEGGVFHSDNFEVRGWSG